MPEIPMYAADRQFELGAGDAALPRSSSAAGGAAARLALSAILAVLKNKVFLSKSRDSLLPLGGDAAKRQRGFSPKTESLGEMSSASWRMTEEFLYHTPH